MAEINTQISTLGPASFANPSGYDFFIPDEAVVLYQTVYQNKSQLAQISAENSLCFEQAGPREKIFFDPAKVSAGIVTCGGLSPGINDVIRALVMELHYRYGVPRILGFRYGYQGLTKKYNHTPLLLTPDVVSNLNHEAGSFLSSSRGNQNPVEMVDYLVENRIDMLFTIGGDGTLRGAYAIYEEITRRKLPIAIVGIPKTIDNDINMIYKTFGFSTAFAKAVEAINSAHAEALGAPLGIGLVKLMGRHSGFIAVNAALAAKSVNFVLIPEKDFDLEGEGAFLEALHHRLKQRGHAVIIAAEGAGQKFFAGSEQRDASGNLKLADIGLFLRDKILTYFKEQNLEVTLKYIDPSYTIRSLPANSEDAIFCGYLAQNAVHAAMAGKTGLLVGNFNNTFTHVPIPLAVKERKVLNPERSSLWQGVLASTGQPNSMLRKKAT